MQSYKVHVNVGTIGHINHCKTTLTAAILAVQAQKGLAEVKRYKDIARGGTERNETGRSPSPRRTSTTRPRRGTTPTPTARSTRMM